MNISDQSESPLCQHYLIKNNKMKKQKSKKKSYRELQKYLKLVEAARDEYKKEVVDFTTFRNDLLEEIDSILTNRRENINYSYHKVSLKLKDLPGKFRELLSKIDGMTQKDGEYRPWINQHQENTNAKLWYLIRMAMGDENLPAPEPDFARDPHGRNPGDFRTPNFNQ